MITYKGLQNVQMKQTKWQNSSQLYTLNIFMESPKLSKSKETAQQFIFLCNPSISISLTQMKMRLWIKAHPVT